MEKPRAAQGPFASWRHRTVAQVDLTEQMLGLLAGGKTYEEIARTVSLTPEFVEKVVRFYGREAR